MLYVPYPMIESYIRELETLHARRLRVRRARSGRLLRLRWRSNRRGRSLERTDPAPTLLRAAFRGR